MTNFGYKKDIPAANHNPAVDQPDMKTNTNSTKDLIAEDHYTFGVDNGGFHKQIRLPDLTAITNLAPRIAKSGTLWTQTAISTGVTTESNLFYVPDLTADSYQLTRTITSKKALFGTITDDYPGSGGAGNFGGWTFLPGGLLLQYGYSNKVVSSNSSTITFPIPFTTAVFNVQATVVTDDNSTIRFSINGLATLTDFTTTQTKSAHFVNLYWQAIGK